MSGDRVFSASHPGAVRRENQDVLLCRPEIEVYAVADGAGGHEDGRTAAEAVIAEIRSLPPTVAPVDRVAALRQRIATAHDALLQRGRAASTLALLMLDKRFFVCLWVGDSRIYLRRDGVLTRLTHDHSLVQELIDAGALTEAAARTHPNANVITRAVGGSAGELMLAKRTGEIAPGDRFLLCSDGLTKTMRDDEICELLGHDGDIADTMLATALGRRARDNVSLIVVCRD